MPLQRRAVRSGLSPRATCPGRSRPKGGGGTCNRAWEVGGIITGQAADVGHKLAKSRDGELWAGKAGAILAARGPCFSPPSLAAGDLVSPAPTWSWRLRSPAALCGIGLPRLSPLWPQHFSSPLGVTPVLWHSLEWGCPPGCPAHPGPVAGLTVLQVWAPWHAGLAGPGSGRHSDFPPCRWS